MKSKKETTARQQRVVDAYRSLQQKTGTRPTQDEVARKLGWRINGRARVNSVIQRLRVKGVLWSTSGRKPLKFIA